MTKPRRRLIPLSSPPNNAVAKAARDVAHEKGKRTGVMPTGHLPKGKDPEDVSKFFRSAMSPDPADMAAGEKAVASSKQDPRENQLKKPAAVVQQKKTAPVVFPGNEKLESSSRRCNGKVVPSKGVSKVMQFKQKVTVSPSDLSVVSTAPPSPAVPTPKPSSTPKIAVPSKSPAVTQDADQEENEDDTTIVQHVTATGESQAAVDKTDDEENFEPVEEDEYSDNDDLLPPPPPPSDDEDEDEFNEGKAGGEATTVADQDHQDVGFAATFDNNDDGVDNDNEEGGFTLTLAELAEQSKETEENIDNEELAGDNKYPKKWTPGSSGKKSKHDKSSLQSADDNDKELEEDHGDFVAEDEGGFNMVHDPETPDSVREERARREEKSLKKRAKEPKKKPSLRKRMNEDISDSDTETPAKVSKGRKTKKKVRISTSPLGYPVGHRDYQTISIEELEPQVETPSNREGAPRRSTRAKVEPLEWWKNERVVFGPNNATGDLGKAMGDMPVVVNIVKALPTPRRHRKVVATTRKRSDKSGQRRARREEAEILPFDSRRLRKKYEFMDDVYAATFDDVANKVVDSEVVSYTHKLHRHDLPSGGRKKSEGHVVGRAAQAFNVSLDESDKYAGYIMGHLELPAGGIKDAEDVGSCAHTFTVIACQPGALEVSYADPQENNGEWKPETAQRFLLSPGDMFRIPQGNSYRLQNHSEMVDSLLTWTIIRPVA